MTANEMKVTARTATVEMLKEVLSANEAVQFADASFAILQVVDGQEIWTEVTVKTKAYKATKTYDAFDPYVVAQQWQEEKLIREQEEAEKKAKKEKEQKG